MLYRIVWKRHEKVNDGTAIICRLEADLIPQTVAGWFSNFFSSRWDERIKSRLLWLSPSTGRRKLHKFTTGTCQHWSSCLNRVCDLTSRNDWGQQQTLWIIFNISCVLCSENLNSRVELTNVLLLLFLNKWNLKKWEMLLKCGKIVTVAF